MVCAYEYVLAFNVPWLNFIQEGVETSIAFKWKIIFIAHKFCKILM